MGEDAGSLPNNVVDQRRDEDGAQKKEFLKRKSQKIAAPVTQSKKYNYYVDNFDETKKKERSVSQAPAPERSIHA